MKEKVITFGKGGSLVGVLTEPNIKLRRERTPAVLLWNAGLLHRVGPYRLYVDLARNLATMGVLVFRFDLSGKGDSEIRKDKVLDRERAVTDIQDAMNTLASEKSVNDFVLMGLCSGADEAFPVAVQDPRVSGLVLLDGFGYRTLGYYLHHYGPRLFKVQPWKNFLKQTCHDILRRMGKDGNEDGQRGRVFVRRFPPKAEVEQDLAHLIKRQVSLLFVYSGGVKYGYYNHHGQFKNMFKSIDFQGRVQVEYFPEAEHTYTRSKDRNKLKMFISEWIRNNYQDVPPIEASCMPCSAHEAP